MNIKKASSYQVGGEHYKNLKVQPWDFMESIFTHEEFTGFLKGCIIKYVSRKKYNSLEDIKKARHCIEKLIEVMEKI